MLLKRNQSTTLNSLSSFPVKYGSTGTLRGGSTGNEIDNNRNSSWTTRRGSVGINEAQTTNLFLNSSIKFGTRTSMDLVKNRLLSSKNENNPVERLFQLCQADASICGITIDFIRDAIDMLLQKHPSLIENIDESKGYNALHHICANNTLNNSLVIIQTLVKASQRAEGLLSEDEEHLQMADAPVAATILRQKSSIQGELPLHLLCKYSTTSSHEVLEYLIQCNPTTVCLSDSIHLNLPIHYICMASTTSPVDLELLKMLVEKWPESTMIPNRDGDLPLHLASKVIIINTTKENDCQFQCVEKKVDDDDDDSNEESCRDASYRRKGYKMAALPKFVQSLQETRRNEQQLAEQEEKLRSNKQLAIVRYLVENYPDALNVCNKQGLTALDVAIKTATETVSTLPNDKINKKKQNKKCPSHPIIRFLKNLRRSIHCEETETNDDDDESASLEKSIQNLNIDTSSISLDDSKSLNYSIHESMHGSIHGSTHVLNYVQSKYTVDNSGRSFDDEDEVVESNPWREYCTDDNKDDEGLISLSNTANRIQNRRMSLSIATNGRRNIDSGVTGSIDKGGTFLNKPSSFVLRGGGIGGIKKEKNYALENIVSTVSESDDSMEDQIAQISPKRTRSNEVLSERRSRSYDDFLSRERTELICEPQSLSKRSAASHGDLMVAVQISANNSTTSSDIDSSDNNDNNDNNDDDNTSNYNARQDNNSKNASSLQKSCDNDVLNLNNSSSSSHLLDPSSQHSNDGFVHMIGNNHNCFDESRIDEPTAPDRPLSMTMKQEKSTSCQIDPDCLGSDTPAREIWRGETSIHHRIQNDCNKNHSFKYIQEGKEQDDDDNDEEVAAAIPQQQTSLIQTPDLEPITIAIASTTACGNETPARWRTYNNTKLRENHEGEC